MKKILLVIAMLSATSVFACPGDQYEVQQVALDANGVITRKDMREVTTTDSSGTVKVSMENGVVDKLTLEPGDEVRLNAAPGIVDATVTVVVKRKAQTADEQGILNTTYEVHEIWTSGWGGGTSEKVSLVTVHSNYLGNGQSAKGCGSVEVRDLPNSTVPPIKKPQEKW